VIARYICNEQPAVLYGQGYGRYPEEYVAQKGTRRQPGARHPLGSNQFILGTKEPTVYDTDVYAFLSCFFTEPYPSMFEWVHQLKEEQRTSSSTWIELSRFSFQ